MFSGEAAYSKASSSSMDCAENFRNTRASAGPRLRTLFISRLSVLCNRTPRDLSRRRSVSHRGTVFVGRSNGGQGIGTRETRSDRVGSANTSVESKDEFGTTSSNAIAQRRWYLWKLSVRSYYPSTGFFTTMFHTCENDSLSRYILLTF